jgi:hypothetical protein
MPTDNALINGLDRLETSSTEDSLVVMGSGCRFDDYQGYCFSKIMRDIAAGIYLSPAALKLYCLKDQGSVADDR